VTLSEQLRQYNRWRRGDEKETMPNPTELGELIDRVADRLDKQDELIHDLAGVLFRLEKYGYIGYEVDDDERDQCDHWRAIGRLAVDMARAKKP